MTGASDAVQRDVSRKIVKDESKAFPPAFNSRKLNHSTMYRSRHSHVIAVDDAPFPREHRGNVPIAGVAFGGLRLEGTFHAQVRRDGTDATRVLVKMIQESRFAEHTRLVLLEGIALAGFNVVDIHGLSEQLDMAVLVVVKRQPNMLRVQHALLERVRGGPKKWALIQKAGAMEAVEGLWVQRAGITLADSRAVLRSLAEHGRMPEPLRVAHLVANVLALKGAFKEPPETTN